MGNDAAKEGALVTGAEMNDPDQTETEIAGGDFAEAQETPPGDRMDFPDDDDVDYEDENRIDAAE
ncbi:hypothetical protein WJX64_00475 [Leifsonia sp. YIM 134122]|uniref:Uncharacterized protein n=1 Tax=Leifsonia stereocauli TaxID=3134136 RepID=A0ABU9VZ40_9MICO